MDQPGEELPDPIVEVGHEPPALLVQDQEAAAVAAQPELDEPAVVAPRQQEVALARQRDENALHQNLSQQLHAVRAAVTSARRSVSMHFECRCRDEDLVRMREELVAAPEMLDGGDDCCPPLLHAVVKEHVRCVAFLLELGADVNKEYAHMGESALSCSVTRSTPDIARMLLAKDATGVNARSSMTKEAPLVRAVKHGNADIVKLLLQHGARPDAYTTRNDESVACVFLAIELGHQEIVNHLLTHGASLHSHAHFDKHNMLYKHVQFAVAEGQVDTLRSLCLHGALRELAKITLYPNLQHSIHCNFLILCVIFRNSNPLEVNLKMLDMLYEFGFNFWKCDKHDKDAWKKLEKLSSNEFSKLLIYKIRRIRSRPLSLKLLCRVKIQEVMGKKFVPNITNLQIPETLFSFLHFDNV